MQNGTNNVSFNKMKGSLILIFTVVLACGIMAIVDAIIQPGYFIKSIIKIALFLILPIFFSFFNNDFNIKPLFKPNKKGMLVAFALGITIYLVVLFAFLLFRNVFDFAALTTNLTATTGVNKANFIWVALYIFFANSLLEEFFFRGYAFLTLKRISNKKLAYIFSAGAFSIYHIAMMIGWFSPIVVLLAILGLFIGGIIFNYFNEKYDNIYLSWLIHMFANFATNTIGFILFSS